MKRLRLTCPKNTGHKLFVLRVPVTWLCDEHGDKLRLKDPPKPTGENPDPDADWSCATCGALCTTEFTGLDPEDLNADGEVKDPEPGMRRKRKSDKLCAPRKEPHTNKHLKKDRSAKPVASKDAATSFLAALPAKIVKAKKYNLSKAGCIAMIGLLAAYERLKGPVKLKLFSAAGRNGVAELRHWGLVIPGKKGRLGKLGGGFFTPTPMLSDFIHGRTKLQPKVIVTGDNREFLGKLVGIDNYIKDEGMLKRGLACIDDVDALGAWVKSFHSDSLTPPARITDEDWPDREEEA